MVFGIWCSVGALIVLIGIAAMGQKKPVSFWANVKPFVVKDIRRYNFAVGLLLIVYGCVFCLLGLPLLFNRLMIILSVLALPPLTIAVMAIHTLVIEKSFKQD